MEESRDPKGDYFGRKFVRWELSQQLNFQFNYGGPGEFESFPPELY